MTLALALAIALLAAALVLEPLLRAARGGAIAVPTPLFGDSDDEQDPHSIRRDRALAALKEIEFDRATGKLSEEDFQRLSARFTAEALEALKEADGNGSAAAAVPDRGDDAELERLISAARGQGGKRGFCLECGAALPASGRFCLECGTPTGV